MICQGCSASIPDNASFCPKCGRGIGNIPAPAAVPDALLEPIQFSDSELHKRFGQVTRPKREPAGLGYATAAASVILIVLLFLPIIETQHLLNTSQNISFFSLLKGTFSSSMENVLQSLVVKEFFGAVTGQSFGTVFWLAKAAMAALFVLPVLVLIFSFLTRGAARFYILLLFSLVGGGILTASRILLNSFANYMQGSISLPAFLPSIDISLLLYCLIFLCAFFGSSAKKQKAASELITE